MAQEACGNIHNRMYRLGPDVSTGFCGLHYVRFHHMYAEIVAAVQGTKTALDLVKATNGLSNYSELLGAVTAVQMKLTDAVSAALASQEKQAALAERVRELEKQVAEVEDWRNQMEFTPCQTAKPPAPLCKAQRQPMRRALLWTRARTCKTRLSP